MEMICVLGLTYFNVENDFQYGRYLLTSQQKALQDVVSIPSIREQYGKQYFERIAGGYGISRSREIIQDHKERIALLQKSYDDMSALLLYMWLVKDHSIAQLQAFCFVTYANLSTSISSPIASTMANGSQKLTTWTEDELSRSIDLMNMMEKITPKELNTPRQYIKSTESESHSIAPLNSIHHTALSRLDRAIIFLTLMRRQTIVLIKLSLGIPVLECLFSDDKHELSHKVSYRTAKYLSDEKEEQLRIYGVVKKAYNVRSEVLHGSTTKMKPEATIELSVTFDEILRQLILKIINKDLTTFSDKRLNLTDYYNDLLFN